MEGLWGRGVCEGKRDVVRNDKIAVLQSGRGGGIDGDNI